MAPTAPSSSVDYVEPKPNFHQHFRQQVGAIQTEIEALSTPELSDGERKSSMDTAFSKIAQLTAELTDASGELAGYDQRSYNQALKDIQDKLAAVQTSHQPKPKFSFRNKRLAAPISEVNSASTSRSVTPSHLKDPSAGSFGGMPVPAIASPVVQRQSQQEDDHEARNLYKVEADLDTDTGQVVIDKLSDAYIQHPSADALGSGQIDDHNENCVLSEITGSVVNLGVNSASASPYLTMKNIISSFVLAPNINGPVHMTGLKNCSIVLGCHQFRMHDSHDVKVWLFCSSRPIIENCSNISFAPAPTIEDHESRVMQSGRTNMYDQVDDFKWLRAEQSPNWRLMESDELRTPDEWSKTGQALRAMENGSSQESERSQMLHSVLETVGVQKA